MKNNSKLIILALYAPTSPYNYFVEERVLKSFLFPIAQLSESGWKSALYILTKQGYIDRVSYADKRKIGLSTKGVEACRNAFPALNPHWQTWDMSWHLVVFSDPPKGDAQFRYLRRQLLSLSATTLTRGVYLIPSIFKAELDRRIINTYDTNVYILPIQNAIEANTRAALLSQHCVEDVLSNYSGISNELNQLLIAKSSSIRFADQRKNAFSTVFYRFWEVLGEDPGFIHALFHSHVHPHSLLISFQSVFESVFSGH